MGSYSNTPVEKDDFTRLMTDPFDDKDMIGIPMGGQSLFGSTPGSQTIYSRDKNVVEINIMRGNMKIAVLVPRGGVPGYDLTDPKLVESKYSAFQRVYPLIEDKYQVHSDQLLFKIPNETDEQRVTREDRAAYLMLEGAKEIVRRIGRMMEYLAWQSLLTGKQPAIYGTSDTNLLYDFLRPSGHTAAVSAEWNTGDPLGDISTGVSTVRSAAHITPDYCIMDALTWSYLKANESIFAYANNRNYNLVRIGPEDNIPTKYSNMVANGFLPVGMLVDNNGAVIYLFLYLDEYQAPITGTVTKYLPVGYALLGSTQARADRCFGPPEMMPMAPSYRSDFQSLFGISLDNPPTPPNPRPGNALDVNAMYFDAYPMGANKGWVLRGQAAPIYVPTMTDAFYVMTGCSS